MQSLSYVLSTYAVSDTVHSPGTLTKLKSPVKVTGSKLLNELHLQHKLSMIL